MHTTVDGQVLDSFGEIIPGLYAAGRSTAGIPTAPYIASGLSVGDCTFFGRRAGRAVVGLEAKGNGLGELRRCHVRRDARGTGMGSWLLTTLLRHARANGFTRISLDTPEHNARSIHFYLRHGFVLEDRREPVHDTSEQMVFLHLDL